jgi:hypothetical protein
MAATFVTVLTVQVKIGASKTNATGTAKTIRTFVLGQPVSIDNCAQHFGSSDLLLNFAVFVFLLQMDAHGVTDLGAFQGVNQDAGNGVRTTLTFVVMQTVSLLRPIEKTTFVKLSLSILLLFFFL